jgi:ATP-binding cassette, subfamily B, bacterial
LDHINFHICAGETIALVGYNGAGKTTLVKLLTRLYDPDDGEILINGMNLKEYALQDLYRRISLRIPWEQWEGKGAAMGSNGY